MPTHFWNPFGVPSFNDQHEGRKWRYKRQEWYDKYSIENPYGEVNMKDSEFLKFYSKHRVKDESMPVAARRITPDRAQHLALTFNMTMYRSTIQKRAQIEDAIYWGYLHALRNLLGQCINREGPEAMRFCRPLYKAYFDGIAPINNLQFLWDDSDIEAAKAKRLRLYNEWNKKRQQLWDRHGFDAIKEDL